MQEKRKFSVVLQFVGKLIVVFFSSEALGRYLQGRGEEKKSVDVFPLQQHVFLLHFAHQWKKICPHLEYRRERVTTTGEAGPSFVFFCTPVPRISLSDDRLRRYSLPLKKGNFLDGVDINIGFLFLQMLVSFQKLCCFSFCKNLLCVVLLTVWSIPPLFPWNAINTRNKQVKVLPFFTPKFFLLFFVVLLSLFLLTVHGNHLNSLSKRKVLSL